MRPKVGAVLALVLIAALAAVAPSAASAPAVRAQETDLLAPDFSGNGDNLGSPLSDERRARRDKAVAASIQGKGPAVGNVAKVGDGEFVELALEDEDLIFTILGEFGDEESPYSQLQGGIEGPQHNEITEPSRWIDNTSIWVDDFSRGYYENLLFSETGKSMTTYYLEQSSGRYTVDGDITDWVQVPYRGAHYGRDFCGDTTCSNVWFFVEDASAAWWQSQLDAGMTPDEIDDYLSQFDVWDRYDYDGDGNFDESDGYIDHFQTVHSGSGQEGGGGILGADAIWSHRWYVQTTAIGDGGPIVNGEEVPFGGTSIGGSKYWIGDYTIEPEDGGVGVFVHEFAHDLDLPDLYDTSGGENSTGFWTLMSSGSNSGNGGADIGDDPTHMGAWEKLQLGWLNYELAFADNWSTHELGSAYYNSTRAQALVVQLPEKVLAETVAVPYEGDYVFYSGSGNDLDNSVYKEFDLPGGSSLSAQVDYTIEIDWDYAYLIASSDGGATWDEVETSVSTDEDPNGQNFGYGITGDSGGWVELTADLSAYTGPTLIGFRYWTDIAAVERGIAIDAIQISGQALEGAESLDGWTLDGFIQTTGTETGSYFNAYIAEYRTYDGYDKSLKTGSYNFGNLDNPWLRNYVEWFSYQDGLLISYWDSSQNDNNTSVHPGAGLILPIDSHPDPIYRADGELWRNRVQTYDATFSKQNTDSMTLHWLGEKTWFPSQASIRKFDDSKSYWRAANPGGSVITPNTDTTIYVRRYSKDGKFISLQVN